MATTVLRIVEDNDRKILDSEITIFHIFDIIWLYWILIFFFFIVLTALFKIT